MRVRDGAEAAAAGLGVGFCTGSGLPDTAAETASAKATVAITNTPRTRFLFLRPDTFTCTFNLTFAL